MSVVNFLGALVLVTVLGGGLFVQKLRLDIERAAHELTRAELAEALAKGEGWKLVYEKALESATAHRDATQACLDRAVEAEKARQEREEIIQAAPPRQRTEEEKHQVVNDETRKRAADRLNRAW